MMKFGKLKGWQIFSGLNSPFVLFKTEMNNCKWQKIKENLKSRRKKQTTIKFVLFWVFSNKKVSRVFCLLNENCLKFERKEEEEKIKTSWGKCVITNKDIGGWLCQCEKGELLYLCERENNWKCVIKNKDNGGWLCQCKKGELLYLCCEREFHTYLFG